MRLHLREQLVEVNLHELSALEDVKSPCGEYRLSHRVCDRVSDTENGHDHNHLHIPCDSLLNHSIFVYVLFLGLCPCPGLGLGKNQIYLDCDSDIAKYYGYRECTFSPKWTLTSEV